VLGIAGLQDNEGDKTPLSDHIGWPAEKRFTMDG